MIQPWERIVEPAVPLQIHAAVDFNGRVISTGGMSNGVPVRWCVATQDAYHYERIAEEPEGFPARYGHAMCVFDGRMWVSGGIVAAAASTDVLISPDGKKWETIFNGPEGIYGHRMLAFGDQKEALVILGGIVNAKTINGIEKTVNGRSWEIVDVFGTIWSPRTVFGALVYKGKLWVFGGVNEAGDNFNDVWWTDDLRHWHLGIEHAAWSPRSAFGYCEYDERMWIIGGKSFNGGRQGFDYLNDVWFSRDGTVWEQSFDFPVSLAHTHASECNRKLHVFDGLLGGSAAEAGVYRQNIG
jgi:hypothetical protein